MSEKTRDYEVAVAESNKKASKVVDTFKVRKSGNSSILTVPDTVKDILNIEVGDNVQYITVQDNEDKDGSTVILKKVKKDNTFDEMLSESMADLDDVLKALVDL